MFGVRNRSKFKPHSSTIGISFLCSYSNSLKCAVNKFYNKFYSSDVKRSLALAGFVGDYDMPCFW